MGFFGSWSKPLVGCFLSIIFADAAAGMLKSKSDYPSDRSLSWAPEAQGLAHDQDNWYVSQVRSLWKIPADLDLNTSYRGNEKQLGVIKVEIPSPLKDQGYNHFGDIDYYQGHVYVPLEGSKPNRLLKYDAETLELKGVASFSKYQKDAAFVAINPESGLVYSAAFTPEKEVGFFAYRMVHDEQGFRLQSAGHLVLRDQKGKPLKVRRIQGAEFDPKARLLYVVSDTGSGGLFLFDMDTGRLKYHQKVKFKPGFPYYEELEGITLWPEIGQKGGKIQGSIHLLLLDNDWGRDEVYMKHYDW